MASEKSELEILDELLENHEDKLDDESVEAFSEWRYLLSTGKRKSLTPKQRQWLMDRAERLEVTSPETANLFSSLSPERQAEQRAKAAKILPWEK